MSYVVVGVSIAMGYSLAGLSRTVGRVPLLILIAVAVLGPYIGNATAILRIGVSFEIMLNHVITGIAVGLVLQKLYHQRRSDGLSRDALAGAGATHSAGTD